MKKRRTLLMVLGGLAALLAATLAGAGWWLRSQASKDALVARIEAEWNCRAHLDDAKLSLFSSPAGIRLKGLRLAPRDGEAGKPLAQRAPLDPGSVRITVDESVLEVTPGDLLEKRISVQRLSFADISVREDIDKNGASALSGMFRKPARDTSPATGTVATGTVAGTAQPSQPAAQAPAPRAAKPPAAGATQKTEKPARTRPGFKAESLGFSLEVQEASLRRASLNLLNRKAKTRTLISDLNFALSEIDLDPSDLGTHNRCKISADGKLTVQGGFKVGKEIRRGDLVQLNLAGQGDARPLDPATGMWSPRVEWDMVLKKDSVIAGNLTLGEAGGDGIKDLARYGIELGDIAIGGPLQQDARIHITFDHGRVEFLQDAVFSLTDYELVVAKGSWANADEDEHRMGLRLLCGRKLQDKVKQTILKTGLIKEATADEFIKAFSDSKGRLFFDIESDGPLSKPKPSIDDKKLLERLLKGGGLNTLLEGALK